MHLIKKNEYPKNGKVIFVGWVMGTPAEIEAYKTAQSNRIQANGTTQNVLRIDEEVGSAHVGSPLFFSPSRDFEDGAQLLQSVTNGNFNLQTDLVAQNARYNDLMLQKQVDADFAALQAARTKAAAQPRKSFAEIQAEIAAKKLDLTQQKKLVS